MEQKQLNHDLAKLREDLDLLPEAVANPGFVVVSGLPGTGKTFFCHKLAEKQPFCILDGRRADPAHDSAGAGES